MIKETTSYACKYIRLLFDPFNSFFIKPENKTIIIFMVINVICINKRLFEGNDLLLAYKNLFTSIII